MWNPNKVAVTYNNPQRRSIQTPYSVYNY
uniref:Uncharacterized protein n=1 Tax=Anguilla anguilla TaxID=7936 RepID=A0A0E9TRQ1_ANGAN